MKKCGLYIRVSTKIQAETIEGSLKIQRQRLEAFIKSRGENEKYIIYKIYEEVRSGKDIERPILQTLLEDIKHKKINIVLCLPVQKINRLLASPGCGINKSNWLFGF